MQAGGTVRLQLPEGGTRAISDMIKALPKGSDASVVSDGRRGAHPDGRPDHGARSDPEKSSKTWVAEADPAAVSEAIHEGARRSLNRMSNTAQEIVVVSDFQKGDWDDTRSRRGAEGAMDQLRRMGTATPDNVCSSVGDNLGREL